ncbi:MAG TPA: hypothetical protein DCX41_07835 [Aequorivita sp.]|mgnify:CR=1 FL=1|nr:hypothetical protein [Pusillimonas sp.]HAV54821.1 hypothetical protein [Aequorivita sp.]|tara:strand:+ start:9758 stop:10966 length:1209 start_codon:yes stop_codon:yes gene_type:complete
MLSKLRSYWKYGSTFCGIELSTVEGGEKVFGATAKKRQGEFTDLKFLQFSLTDVDKNLPQQQHCFLAINSHKVLIKSVPNQESDLKTVSTAFPGLSLTDFYYEILKTPHNSIVSICRKDYVQNVLVALERQQIHVLSFHLGITPLQVLVPLLTKNKVSIPRYQIDIEDNNISNLVSNEHQNGLTYELEDIKVASEHLLSLALLFNYTGSAFNSSNNFAEENKNLSKLHQEKVFFKKGMFLGVGLLLISLLVNTFFFNAYFKKEQQLYEESVFMESQQKGMEGKLETVSKKEQLVDHILNSGSSKSSYYLNRIVAVKPSSIGFSDIQYQPLGRSIRPDKSIEYSENNIVISGESKDKGDFSQWITDLGKLKWVEKASVIYYGNAGKGLSSFSITIAIKNESKD